MKKILCPWVGFFAAASGSSVATASGTLGSRIPLSVLLIVFPALTLWLPSLAY